MTRAPLRQSEDALIGCLLIASALAIEATRIAVRHRFG
jgi:hypothetical protein